jgi:hypothetical protein
MMQLLLGLLGSFELTLLQPLAAQQQPWPISSTAQLLFHAQAKQSHCS